jgi:hypothetical protein
MAERPSAPSQSVQASDRSKAEGERPEERDAARDVERDARRDAGRDAKGRDEATGRDAGRDALRTGRGGLDPTEVRGVLDETSEKHRRGEDIGASGLTNPTLAEQQEEQAELPPRTKTRKSGGGA